MTEPFQPLLPEKISTPVDTGEERRNHGMKRISLLLLAAALLLSLCACGSDTDASLPGSGTAEDPYRIATAAELRRMAKLVNSKDTHDDCAGAHYLLTADIQLGGSAQWNPIGTDSMPFRGVLDGGGHTVRGIRIDYKDPLMGEKQSCFALVGRLTDGTVRNLTVSDSTIRAEGDGNINAAAVVAVVLNGTVENCHTTDSVSVTATYQAAGICTNLNSKNPIRSCTSAASVTVTGNVGSAAGVVVRSDGHVENCVNTGVISSAGDGAGIASTANAGLSDCRNEGPVTAENGYAAGIVCRFGDGALNHSENDDTVTLLRCVNTGDIRSASDPAGGIATRCSTGHIARCENSGSISSPMEAGGIFAYFNLGVFGTPCARFTVTDCVNSGAVANSENAGIYSIGGIAGMIYGSDTEFLFENCVNSGSILSGEAAGGILGSSDATRISFLGCVNSGAITGVGVCGGIVGEANPYSGETEEALVFAAENCRNEGVLFVNRDAMNFGGTVFLDSYAGGIAGRCWNLPTDPAFDEVRIIDCENTGTISGENADTHFWSHDLCGCWAAPEA